MRFKNTEKCSKCKKIAYEHGGMTYHKDQMVCMECLEKAEKRDARILLTKNFIMEHWKYWISTGLVITGLVIAYFSFLSAK